MAEIVIRNLEGDVVEHLTERARKNGPSLVAEVRAIITERMEREHYFAMKVALERAAEIRRRFAGRDMGDSVDLIREDRER